jgi:hypothetical protein
MKIDQAEPRYIRIYPSAYRSCKKEAHPNETAGTWDYIVKIWNGLRRLQCATYSGFCTHVITMKAD